MKSIYTKEAKVKFIDKYEIDKKGNPKKLAGTVVETKTRNFPGLYDEADKKDCNIVKIPIGGSGKDKITVCSYFDLEHRELIK